MQRAEHADHREDREPQGNLDQCIAREPAMRILPRTIGTQGELRRQGEPVERGEYKDQGESGKLEHQELSVAGHNQSAERTDQYPRIDEPRYDQCRDADGAKR